jgi:hypothetical protein
MIIFRAEDVALKMETICVSETLASTYESTWRQNPKQERRHPHRRENLKTQSSELCLKTLFLHPRKHTTLPLQKKSGLTLMMKRKTSLFTFRTKRTIKANTLRDDDRHKLKNK